MGNDVYYRVKIIGENIDKEKRFFQCLADALKAFLEKEISQITILGEDFSCQFSQSQLKINGQKSAVLLDAEIEAPIVSLKLLSYNAAMSDYPQFPSVFEAFRALFGKKIKGLQIYEQKQIGGDLIGVTQNYMVVFDWDNDNKNVIILHLHNTAVRNNYFWRKDFKLARQRNNDFDFLPYWGDVCVLPKKINLCPN